MSDDWIAPLIGAPWRAGAAGPAEFDCKGLVAHALGRLGLPVPSLLLAPLGSPAQLRAVVAQEGWRPAAGRPCPGDILLCHGAGGAHVGVMVEYPRLGVLHAAEPCGVRFDALDELLGAYGRASLWRWQP